MPKRNYHRVRLRHDPGGPLQTARRGRRPGPDLGTGRTSSDDDILVFMPSKPKIILQVDLPSVEWLVSVGALAALVASMFGSMFPMPRVAYAMAKDELLCG